MAQIFGVFAKHRKSIEVPARLPSRPSAPEVVVLHAGDYLYKEGESRTCVYRIENGVIAVFGRPTSRPGQIIEIAGHGDYVALGCLEQHTDNAKAVVETTVSCVPRAEFSLLAEMRSKACVKTS
jgi:CRP-like cAMP-binding protein